jgi:hypothetical protein
MPAVSEPAQGGRSGHDASLNGVGISGLDLSVPQPIAGPASPAAMANVRSGSSASHDERKPDPAIWFAMRGHKMEIPRC